MSGMLPILFLIILGTSSVATDARIITVDKVIQLSDSEIQGFKVNAENERLCTVCEEFASAAVDYLSQNKTQAEIIDSLHQACSELQSLKQQCMLLVDYYAPLFFREVGLITPDKFCAKVNLCSKVSQVPLLRGDDTCTICRDLLSEFLTKLKDPDTELEIIETLLKLCNTVERYTQQCKMLVFEYAPVILINAEKFFEKTDICTYIHACKSTEAAFPSELAHQDA